MNESQITKLLVAAMQRHVTWISNDGEYSVFVPRGWQAFSIDEDVSYEPPYSEANPHSRTYIKYSHDDLERAARDHIEMRFTMWGDIFNEPPTISKGVYFLMPLSDGKLHPYTIYSPEPIDDNGATGDTGKVTYSYQAIELVIALTNLGKRENGKVEYGLETRYVSLFELLMLMALQDAQRAGRTDDISALSSLIPHDYGSNLTEAQEAEILSHIGEAKPDIVRGGSKVWTDIMGASSRNRTFRGDGIIAPIDTALTFAGANGDIVIHTNEAGKALSIDAGTMKLLYQLNAMVTKADRATGGGVTADIETSFDELLQPRGKTATRKNKDAIKRQIGTLSEAKLKFQTSEIEEGSISIASSVFYYRRGGKIRIALDPNFKKFVLGHNAGLTPVDPVLLTTDDVRHPHAWAIGNRLIAHAYMNYGRTTEHRISVASLLANVKSIPSIQELEDGGESGKAGVRGDRNHTARIIAPLERDLNHLVEIGFLKDWDYCHSNDNPLTDEEQDARIGGDGEGVALPYSIAKNCLITWIPSNDYVGHMQAVTDARTRKKERDTEGREAEAREAEKRAKRIERKTENAIAQLRAKATIEGENGESVPPLSQKTV